MNMANASMESFSSELEPAKIGIIAASSAITGLALFSFLGLLFAKKKVSARLAVCCVQWLIVIGVSLTAWGITYSQMKEAVETQVENLIVTIAGDLQAKVSNELDVATKINTMHKLLGNINLATTNNSMEEAFLFLQAQWLLFSPDKKSLLAIYYANRYGYLYSIAENCSLYAVWPRGHCTAPPSWACTYRNEGPATRETCEGLNGSQPLNEMRWGSYELGSVGSFPPGVVLDLTGSSYDPRTRPWYRYTESSTWTPYMFNNRPSVGITATMGTKDSTGAWEGVLAVDIYSESIRTFILPLLPTKNTVILLYTTDGVLISGSIPEDRMQNQTDPQSTLNVWYSNDTTIARMMSVVHGKIGTTAPSHMMVFHSGRHVVLLNPVSVTGGLDLVIMVDIPYGDVLGQAEDASTASLLLVFLLSLGCMALVAGGVTVALRPLRVLASNMQLAAWMKVEGLQKVDSRIIELRSMITSFETMVANLVEYKKYLPDALLAVQSETEEEANSHGDTGSRVSTSKATSLNSYDPSMGMSGGTGAARPTAVQQVFGSEMVQRYISVAVLRLHRMKKLLGSLEEFSRFQTVYGDFLECVQQQAKEHKGVIDTIFGDRVTLTFNAASSNSGHKHKVCAMLLRTRKAWEEQQDAETRMSVSAGAATGSTVCGNCGSKALKRFGVFGLCVGVARALEVHCGGSEAVYISEQLTQSVEGRHDVLKLRQVTFTSIGTPQIIAQLIRAKDTTHQGEWMYALQDSENTGYAAYNSALCLMLEGKYAEAEEKLKRSPLEGLNQGLRVRIRACVAGRVEEPVVLFADDF